MNRSVVDVLKKIKPDHQNADSQEWLDRTKQVRFPFTLEAKDGRMIEFLWMTPEVIPAIYELIQDFGKEAESLNPEDFHPIEKVYDLILPLIPQKLAFQMRDAHTKKIIGMYYVQPAPMCRSATPVLSCGYAIIHKDYQASGIGGVAVVIYALVARKGGYVGVLGRSAVTYPISFSSQLSKGSVLTGYLPKSQLTPKLGWTDDCTLHYMLYSQNDPIIKVPETKVLSRAKSVVHGSESLRNHTTFSAVEQTLTLKDEIRATIYSTKTHESTKLAYDVLSEAANRGEGFGLDEFPTMEIFQRFFLKDKQLLLVDIAGKLAGVAVLGPSHLCRNVKTPNAVIYFYLLHQHRGKGYGKSIFKTLEKLAEENGYKAIMIDALITKDLPFKFLQSLGYTITGGIPYSAYVKHQGWTDTLIFYKSFESALLLSYL